MSGQRVKEIFAYHNRTKHGFQRLAASPGFMDWENQPLPFRFYEDALRIELPLGMDDPERPHLDLYRRGAEPLPYRLDTLSKFLELSLGLSAWKELGGQRWSLRMNPSSGNLHPTECYLLLPSADSLPGGLHHYDPFGHRLEHRAESKETDNLAGFFGCHGFLAGLGTIFWREAWKYGERAYRYCNHDAGHALACMAVAANLLGWKLHLLDEPAESEISTLLGLDRTEFPSYESERAELLCFVATDGGCELLNRSIPAGLLKSISAAGLAGAPNRLSREHREWPVIESVAEHARKEATLPRAAAFAPRPLLEKTVSPLKAAQIIRRRRSAFEFSLDKSFASRSELLSILDRTLPRSGAAPFDCLPGGPADVQLALFVHNVSGLDSGLYMLLRDETAKDALASALDLEFIWERVDKDLPLFLLREGNYRNAALTLSCNQQIAGFGVFAVAMLARFEERVSAEPWAYPRLLRECGMVGQTLYLEAEAQGLRGTGIGCYFDDPVHELLGIKDLRWQSMYHFTVGAPIEDERLKSYPPYFHLKR